MSAISSSQEKARRGKSTEEVFDQLRKEEREILEGFSPSEQQSIRDRLDALKGVVDMVSADTTIQVFVNHPGGGWFWDYEQNYIRVDAEALLSKPIEENRFFLAHEAAHRRLTHPSFLPKELAKKKGFHMLYNILEDGRINLWLQEKYPLALQEGMHSVYASLNMDDAQRELLKSGKAPHAILAYNEMLRLWFAFARGEKLELTPGLPKAVRNFFDAVVPHLKVVWQSYPKPGAEANGSVREAQAKRAVDVTVKKIWPHFKKFLKESAEQMAKADYESECAGNGKGEGEGAEGGGDEGDGEEVGKGKKGKSNKKKGKGGEKDEQGDGDFDSLPRKEKERRLNEAEAEVEDSLNEIADAHEGKMGNADDEQSKAKSKKESRLSKKGNKRKGQRVISPGDLPRNINAPREGASAGPGLGWIPFSRMGTPVGKSRYDSLRAQAAPIIKELIAKLEQIFKKRLRRGEDSGHRDGDDIDVDRIIDEKASTPPEAPVDSEPPVWTRKFQKEDGPRDYAFSIVLDLSGSMAGVKIQEALRGVIAIVEALAYFGIEVEVIGFGNHLYEAKPFDQPLDASAKSALGSLNAKDEGTLLGRAISEGSKRLSKRGSKQKTMIVITDGMPGDNAKATIKGVREETDITVIGIGLGYGTEEMRELFGKGIAGDGGVGNVPVEKLAATLAQLIHESIDKR